MPADQRALVATADRTCASLMRRRPCWHCERAEGLDVGREFERCREWPVRSVCGCARIAGQLKVRPSTSANTGVAPCTTALAVVYDIDGTMTSSAVPIPAHSAKMQRCQLHDETATACRVPPRSAMASSNSATFGLKITSPTRLPRARRARLAHFGLATGMQRSLTILRRTSSPRRASCRAASPTPQALERIVAVKPGARPRLHHEAPRRRAARSGWNSGRTSASIALSSKYGSSSGEVSIPEPTLYTRSSFVGAEGQHVRAGDVRHMDEVHGLRALTEDHRRLTRLDAFHPADEHLGVLAETSMRDQ